MDHGAEEGAGRTMRFLGSMHGNTPTGFQLAATYAVGIGAAVLALATLGLTWKTVLLAILAFDWAGGVVANSADPVRAWWRDRPRMQAAFIIVHLIELPLVFWLTDGGAAFYVLALVLAAKLSVFVLGGRWSNRTMKPL